MRLVLAMFGTCYTLRVIRNVLLVIYWGPCYTVHRDLTTNFLNTIFLLCSDGMAIFGILIVHHKNYKNPTVEEPFTSESNEESENFTIKQPSLTSQYSSSVNTARNDSEQE